MAPTTTFDHWDSGTATGTEVTPSAASAWHGNGTFLALTNSGGAEMLRSSDGRTWTGFTPVSAGTTTPIRLERLVYSQLRWLGLSDGRIVVSTDNAFTWSPLYQAPPRDGETEGRRFLALALSGNRLAAVGTAGLIATSRDGATWTDESISSNYDLVALAPGQDSFLAAALPMAGAPSGTSALARPRAEGSGWELVEPATLSGLTLMQLAGGNGRFVAYAGAPMPPPSPPAALAPQSETPTPGFYRSEDLGSTWARVGRLQIPSSTEPPAPLVAFVDQSFVVSWTGTPPQSLPALPSFELHVSADAMEWTAHPTGAGGSYTAESFATGDTSVVAVSPRRLLVATRRPWPQPVFVTERLDPFRVGTNYLVALDARGSGTLTYELVGTLPPGLTFRSTGSFHGTPTQAGSSAVTVRARDARGGVAERTFSVDVVSDLSISSGALASATQGSPYEARFTASGGRAPYLWNLAGGTLPSGLTLQQTDGAYVLSGRPTLSGNFALTVRVTDSANQTAERAVSLQIVAPPPPPEDEGAAPGGCGCNGGGAGVQALGLAALALVARIRRKQRQA
ncbi:Ig domain-containing protein [Myxococcus hansupus]|uniref:Ig domain-containing protein n=1 Tax=Pseudomyxococcus hansupus TaxID=1297742 RepID=UPI001D03D26C|nr:Ig domain-containing protein [Myxococcus hansupus]